MSERYVVGIGASSLATVDECLGLIAQLMDPSWAVGAVASVESKQDLAASVADALGVESVIFTAAELEKVIVPTPSSGVRDAIGISSVAEAAAIRGSGGGPLVVRKTSSRYVTVAVASEFEAVNFTAGSAAGREPVRSHRVPRRPTG